MGGSGAGAWSLFPLAQVDGGALRCGAGAGTESTAVVPGGQLGKSGWRAGQVFYK